MTLNDDSSVISDSSFDHPTVDFSRTVSLSRLIAIGGSVTIALGVFVLLGPSLLQTGQQTPFAYIVAMVFFLPIVLTYAERALVVTGSGGVLSLVRAGGSVWRTYASGWLLLGGHLALISLLGLGAAFYLNSSLERLLSVSIEMHWLAPSLVLLVALNDLIGTRGRWRLRIFIVYGSIAVLLFIIGWIGFFADIPPSQDLPVASSSVNVFRVIALLAAGLWGIHFVLDKRDEIRNPERTLLPALVVSVTISGILGALIAGVGLRFVVITAEFDIPLVALAKQVDAQGEILFEVISVTLGLLICLVALDKGMVVMVRLVGTMVRDGFFSEKFLKISPGPGTPMAALRLFAVLSAIIAAFVPLLIMVGFVAIIFLWVTVLLNIPDVLGRESQLPEKRPLKLPFYPLFPGLAAGVGGFLPFYLSPQVVLLAGAWVVLGAIHYVRYARQGNIDVRRREAVVSNVAEKPERTQYTVLVSTANPETAPILIRMGARLAKARGGRLTVLKVAVFADQVPQYVQRQWAEKQWLELKLLTRRVCRKDDIQVDVLVRMAQSPIDGILGTVQDERVNLLLLGWEGDQVHSAFDLDPVLDPIVRAAPCEVVVMRGDADQKVSSILVPTDGSPNSLASLQLAQVLAQKQEDPHIVALNLVDEKLTSESLEQATARLQKLVEPIDGETKIDPLVLSSDDVREGILHVAPSFDLIILGASRGGVLDQVIFGGVPVEVARKVSCPVLLVKHYEGARKFWFRRVWEVISSPFPALGDSERDNVYHDLQRAAHPSIDFFVLMGLSAMIATLGLMQSSPAVIIGAMLVAPLMSPIISMAMGIVRGDPYLLRLSVGSTLQGVVLAISVSIGVTLLSPAYINTSEILARTQPNLLDLLVALASGAAAGYAMGRKEVAAAMPGVAIAAALVPPLSVAGYGTATAQLDIAGGAVLLFTTNLIAIVFAAAVVFLLLGFRPLQTRMHGHVRLGFLLSLVALVIISIPLAVFSVDAIEQISRQSMVEQVLSTEVESDVTRITDVVVEQQGEGFVVYATLYTLRSFPEEQVIALERRLSTTVGAPVTLRATVLQAVLLPDRGNLFLPTPTSVP
jgi:uncharacterized hydrophobic protein (TIGR00271 family)